MTNLNLGQDVANKRERKWMAAAHNSGQILSPIASCNNVSLRFSYFHQTLCVKRKLFLELALQVNASSHSAFYFFTLSVTGQDEREIMIKEGGWMKKSLPDPIETT